MNYTPEEIIEYVEEEDVKFIRLAFIDLKGNQKNVSIMPNELRRAFEYGIAFDASAIDGFTDVAHSDLFLHPDPDTLSILSWRPEHGRVVRLYCTISHPDGTPLAVDSRTLLENAVKKAAEYGLSFSFGSEMEFYLFLLDENGNQTFIPYDRAGYMDLAPEDKGENIRREVCLTLEQMGIIPETSHHEAGPGQNEIDFRFSDALSAADNAMTFQNVVKTIASRNGLWACFTPRPLADEAGNGYHINISMHSTGPNGPKSPSLQPFMLAGILKHISGITAFLNPGKESYRRLGRDKAPLYVSWSPENRSQLIRVPAVKTHHPRIELRSPDSLTNPYIAFSLLIYAALDGYITKSLPAEAINCNLFEADDETLESLATLPANLEEAIAVMKESDFVKKYLPNEIINYYSRTEN